MYAGPARIVPLFSNTTPSSKMPGPFTRKTELVINTLPPVVIVSAFSINREVNEPALLRNRVVDGCMMPPPRSTSRLLMVIEPGKIPEVRASITMVADMVEGATAMVMALLIDGVPADQLLLVSHLPPPKTAQTLVVSAAL